MDDVYNLKGTLLNHSEHREEKIFFSLFLVVMEK